MRVTGEYSYHSKQIGGDGFCLVGDAFAFLDPLFSTGVFLALKSGEMAADAIHAGLEADDLSASRFDELPQKQRHAVTSFRPLVCAFYDLTFSFREFLKEYPHLHCSIVDTLVGNVFNDLTPLFKALGRVRQARYPRRNAPPRRLERLRMPASIATSGACSSTRPTSPASCTSAGTSTTWRKPSTRSGGAWA